MARWIMDFLGRLWWPALLLCILGAHMTVAEDRLALKPDPEAATDGQKRVLVVGPRDTENIEYVVRLAGHRFVVPANILDTIFIESNEVQGELNRGFDMIALLPAFQGRTEENLQQFLVGSAQVNRVRISLNRTCPPPPLPYVCTVPVRASQALDSQWGDLVQAADIAPQIPGLVRSAQLVQPPPGVPSAPTGEVRSDVFDIEASVGRGGITRVEFITCDAPGAVPVLHCDHLFAWRDAFWVTLVYKREHLSEWEMIKANAVQLISDLADIQPGAAETSVYFP